jgi:hypothetical protein
VNTSRLGALWRGQTDVIRRLVEGVDWAALENGTRMSRTVRGALSELQFRVNYPITLQDAVDLASFLIRTTVETQRFTDGTYRTPGLIPSCGGAMQALAITKGGTHWIQRPRVTAVDGQGQAGT